MQTVITLLASTVFVFIVERVLMHLWDKLHTKKNNAYRRKR